MSTVSASAVNGLQTLKHYIKEKLRTNASLLARKANITDVVPIEISGSMDVVRKWRKGKEMCYPSFELDMKFSCSIHKAFELSKGVPEARATVPAWIRIPYFGDECEAEDLRFEVQFQKKKDELRCTRDTQDKLRAQLKCILAPLLLTCIDDVMQEEAS